MNPTQAGQPQGDNAPCGCVNCPAAQVLKGLEEKNRSLETENLRLKLELQEFRERYWLGKKKKKLEEESTGQEELPKKRGPPFGHPGWFRKKPTRKLHRSGKLVLYRSVKLAPV
ncbi:MAG: hypothetical protein AAB876_01125, partial [Patescibacteria group bacterium]